MATLEKFPQTQIPDEQLVRPHERLEKVDLWLQKKTQYFRSDSVMIPTVAAKKGIYLDKMLESTLHGQGETGDNDITGLGKASRTLGAVINRKLSPSFLFEPNYDQEGESVLPAVSKLEELDKAGEAGSIFLQMVKDTVEPYKPHPGDGYTELVPRDKSRAYKTKVYDIQSETDAKMCSNAEVHFSSLLQFGVAAELEEIKLSGETVALQKKSGEHTAILVKPAVLNGVRLPVGSIMMVEKDELGKPAFAFGRLSAFCFERPEAGQREFASIFAKEASMARQEWADFNAALTNFNRYVGRTADIGPMAAVNEYVKKSGGKYTPLEAAKHLQQASEQAISENQVARLMLVDDKRAQTIAQTAWRDKQAERAATDEPYDPPKEWPAALKKLIQSRLELTHTFGRPSVEQARELIYLNKALSELIRR